MELEFKWPYVATPIKVCDPFLGRGRQQNKGILTSKHHHHCHPTHAHVVHPCPPQGARYRAILGIASSAQFDVFFRDSNVHKFVFYFRGPNGGTAPRNDIHAGSFNPPIPPPPSPLQGSLHVRTAFCKFRAARKE